MSSLRRNLMDELWFSVLPAGGAETPVNWRTQVPKDVPPLDRTLPVQPAPRGAITPLQLTCSFTLDSDFAGSAPLLEFDRLNGSASVWINGTPLGERTGFYSPCTYELAGKIAPGANVLALQILPHTDLGDCCDPVRGLVPPPAALCMPSFSGLELAGGEPSMITSIAVQPDIRRNRIMCVVKTACGGVIEAFIDGNDERYTGNGLEFGLEFECYTPWSPETPQQYDLVVRFTADDGRVEERRAAFGMREFTVKDQRFHLNGRPYFVHGVAFEPPSSAAAIQDGLKEIKAAGFNLVRISQAGLSHALLDAAAACGMLVHCNLILSHPKESDAYLKETLDRFSASLTPHLNSPALAIIGLADAALTVSHVEPRETLQRIAPAIEGLRALDPSRLFFFGQGFAAATGALPAYVRPYRPDQEPYVDIVFYGDGPHTPDEDSFLRNVGDEATLNYASSLFSAGLADSAVAFSTDGLEEAFTGRSLDRIFETPAAFRKSARALQADGISAVLTAARGNRNLAGYCFESWADPAQRPGTGLHTPDGTAKIGFRSLQELQVAMRPIIQIQRTNLMVREETNVQVLLTNLDRAEGRVELSLQVVGPTNQVLWKKKRSVKLPKHGRELWSGTISASGSTGRHRFIVRVLQNFQRIAESGCDFTVLDEVKPSDQEVHVVDPEKRFAPAIAKLLGLQNLLAPVHIIPPLSDTIVSYPDNDVLQALAQVKGGAVAIFFNPPKDIATVLNMLQPEQTPWELLAVDDFDCHYHFNRLHPVFDHLPAKSLLGSAYRYVQPRYVSAGGSDEEICGAWLEGAPAGDETRGCAWGTAIASRRYGSGRIVLCTLRVLEALDFDPLAQHLLLNMVAHFTRRSIPSLLPLPLETQPVEWMRRNYVGVKRKWLVIGEFPNTVASPGHDTAYPPESEINTGMIYPGWYRPVSWKHWCTNASEAHLLDFQAAVPGPMPAVRHCAGGAWYAYGEFNAEQRERFWLKLTLSGGAKVWLNGVLAADEAPQSVQRTCQHETTVRQGRNTVLLKYTSVAGAAEIRMALEHLTGAPLPHTWWR